MDTGNVQRSSKRLARLATLELIVWGVAALFIAVAFVAVLAFLLVAF